MCFLLAAFLAATLLGPVLSLLDPNFIKNNSFEVSEFVSNDTFSYIVSYSPFVLDGFKEMSSFSQMRSLYYDINDFEDVNNQNFNRLTDDQGEYRYITLENKIKAFLVSKPILYKSSIAIVVRYGAFNEPESMKGISLLLKNLIVSKIKFKKRKRKNPLYFKNLENMVEGVVTGYGTEINIEVFNEDFVDVLHDLGEVLSRPLETDSQSLLSLKKSTREEIRRRCTSVEGLKAVVHKNNYCNLPGHRYLSVLTNRNSNKKDIKRGYRIGANPNIADEYFYEYNNLDRVLGEEFNKYYSGGMIVLSVVSNENMDYLTSLVKTFFGNIRSSNLTMEELINVHRFSRNPYLEHRGNIAATKEKTEKLELRLAFPIPYQKSLWRYKLSEYLSFYLDDESDEGLIGALRSRGWISSLSSGCENSDEGYSNFVILIILQKEGVAHIFQILEALFSTVKLISKQEFSEEILQYIREETSIELMNLYLELDVDQANFILRSYLETGCFPKDVLVAPFVMEKVESKHIRKFISFIRPENMVISYPVRSIRNGASYYLRLSKSFSNSPLQVLERYVFSGFYTISRFFLSWFGVNFESVTYKSSKNLYYSEEKLPFYLRKRLMEVTEKIALEDLKIQLFDFSQETYSKIYIDENEKGRQFPVSLREALSENGANPGISLQKDLQETESSAVIQTGKGDGERTRDSRDLQRSEKGFYEELGKDGQKVEGDFIEYDDRLITTGLEKYSEELEKGDLSGRFDTDSFFYMPLINKVPTLSLRIDMTIPFDINNSTDLLLLNMDKQKLLLLSFLFKNSLFLSMEDSNIDGGVVVEDYSDFLSIRVLPGLQLSWDGNTKYFDDFIDTFVYNLVNFKQTLKKSYFEESMVTLKKLLGRLSNANNEEYSLMQLLQILHLESIKPWALENDAKLLSFEDIKVFGKVLLKYGEVHGIVIGNCTPSQIFNYLNGFIKMIRPTSKFFNSVELINSEKIKMLFGSYGDDRGSMSRQLNEPIFRRPENRGSLFNSRLIDMSILPDFFHRNYLFKMRVSNTDPFNSILLYISLGAVSEKNRVLLDLLELVDFSKALKLFIANRKSIHCSTKVGTLFLSPEVASFQISVTFLSGKIASLVNTVLEFFKLYFLKPEKVFFEKDFLSLKNMLLSKLQQDSLNPTKLAQIHYDRIIRSNLVPDWQIREAKLLKELSYTGFINLLESFRAAPTILIAIQSNRNYNDREQGISEFVPEGYTRMKSIYQFKDSI
ncbi:Peptidase M16 inactive domain protein [Cryptosporidium felis]|nr:Peptidase M16 inactive domain protein [Cryptosporidium felis]